MPSWTGKVTVGARSSPLSRAQVAEIARELAEHHPEAVLEPIFLETLGDRDQKTSLRALHKCDFFTRDLDERVAKGGVRIAVHSAKDLPEPLPDGLTVVALTKGVDSSDSLVLRKGEELRPGMTIATSSERREEVVRALCGGLTFVDIRGNVNQRIAQVDGGAVDGVVVAEAAIIRLGLCDRHRIRLPGETTPYQGQLAVVAKSDDREMAALFAPLDVRRGTEILYLGLDPSRHLLRGRVTHYPVIRICPLEWEVPNLGLYSHLIFTSKTAVALFFERAPRFEGAIVAVGSATANTLKQRGMAPTIVAKEESSEGLIEAMDGVSIERILWPHSKQSRGVIPEWAGGALDEIVLYDTVGVKTSSQPDLDRFSEIAFTSPSTVDAFLEIYGKLPDEKKIWAQGHVTASKLFSVPK